MDWLKARRDGAMHHEQVRHKSDPRSFTVHNSTKSRRRSSAVAGLEDIDHLRTLKSRRQSSATVLTTTTSTLKSLRLARQHSVSSPFLALPAEIRNQIYSSLFANVEAKPLIKPTYTLPGILKSCRQIHAEAIGIFYSSSVFRCLDEESTISWLTHLPRQYLSLVSEVRYDTRWINFKTPYIPVPGAECWLYRRLVERMEEVMGKGEWRELEKKVKCSFYRKIGAVTDDGDASGIGWAAIGWTDKVGLIESLQ